MGERVIRRPRALLLAFALLTAAASMASEPPVQTLDRATLVPAAPGGMPESIGTPVSLPHEWSAEEARQGGDAWYVLAWRLPGGATGTAVYVPAVTAAAEIWVNGEIVGRTGPLEGRPPRSFEQQALYSVPDDLLREGENVIAVRMRVRPGAGLAPLEAGPRDVLAGHALRDLAVHTLGPAAVGVATAAGGLLILGLWARRRDPQYGLFGAAALLWGIHTLLTLLPRPPLPQPHWFVLWHAIYMLFVGLLCLFMVRFAEVGWHTYRRGVVVFVVAVVPALYLSVALGVQAGTGTAVRATGIALVMAALYAVVRRAMQVVNVENVLLLVTGAVSAVFAVHDWLAAQSDDVRPVWLVPYAALAFLLLVGWILTDRFVRALNESERANQQLEARVREKNAALEQQLAATQEARDAAEAANVAKSRFLAAASHDLRQPLHAIGLFTAALAEQTTHPEQTALVQRITRSVDSLEALFSALLDISKLDAGVVTPHLQHVDADALLDRLAQEFAPEALRKNLKIAFVRTRAVLHSDPILLERIVRNLVSNALRYTDRGGVVVGCRPRQGKVAIEVWDSGPGIPEADRERIFEEFYQAGSRELDRAGGLGLGLAIVRRLAELLDHPIVLDARPSHGSVFRVIVPRGERALVPAPLPAPALAPGVLAGRRVLVIEDETPVRQGMERLLHAWGCVPMLAADAQSALDLVTRGPLPDAAVVDFRLRIGSDGLAALEAIAQRIGRRVPAVIVSGESHPDELARIQASGCLLLHKPLAPARLHAALAWLVGQRAEAA